MRPGTLGESTDEERNLRVTRSKSTSRTTEFTLRNPYERPSTSAAARNRGELEMTTASRGTRNQKASTTKIGAARRKQKTHRQRQLADLRKIVKLQNSTKLQIPKAPFCRVVREISLQMSDIVTHYTPTALEALHEATEMFLTQVFQDAYMLTLHRKCITLSVSDMVIIRALKLNM